MTTKCDEFDKHVGRRLALARQRAGFTVLAAAAERLNISRQLLAKYENADVRTPSFVLQQAATVYGVSVLFFFAGMDRSSTRDHQIVQLARSLPVAERRALQRKAMTMGVE